MRAIAPANFGLHNSVWLLGMVIVGGMGSTAGAVFGTIFIRAIDGVAQALVPIISSIFAETHSIGETLKLSRIFQLVKTNYLQLLGVALLAYIASYAASMVGMWLFFIGMFFTMPIGMAISHHLYGQVYRNALIKLDESPAA